MLMTWLNISLFDKIIIVLVAVVGAIYLFRRRQQTAGNTDFHFVAAPPTFSATTEDEGSFVSKMKAKNRTVVVFYGSQTGTAEDFAARLAKDAARYGLKAMVADPEEYEASHLINLRDITDHLAIFCVATYGEGDPTDNAQEFYDWLKDEAEPNSLENLNYVVFGLGNKTYEKYNSMGTYFDKRLSELGANRLYPLGLGDDDANIEEDFVTWKEQMWPVVCPLLGVSADAQDLHARQFILSTPDPELPPSKVYSGEPARLGSYRAQRPPFDAKNPYLAPVLEWRELHNGGGRSCMHIEFDISGSRLRYEAGDHVAIYPTNNSDLVDNIGRRLGVDLDTLFSLNNVDEDSSKKHPFPCPTSYRTALTYYLDLTNPVKTNVLSELAEFTEDEADRQQLQLMASNTPEGRLHYTEWVLEDKRHILAVLEDLPSIRIPLDYLCELLPRLQARYYSISSSPKQYPHSVHITAVLVDYETRVGRHMLGVATGWLANKRPLQDCAPEDRPRVPIYIRRSQLRLPYRSATSVIMVGPGTGLAPFRGFLQERQHIKKENKPLGRTMLFFGCRKKNEDYIYRTELEQMKVLFIEIV